MSGLLADAGYAVGVVSTVLAKLLILSSLIITDAARLAERLSSVLHLVFVFRGLVGPCIVSADIHEIFETLI